MIQVLYHNVEVMWLKYFELILDYSNAKYANEDKIKINIATIYICISGHQYLTGI